MTKKIILFFIIALSYTNSYSQLFNWTKAISGASDEFASSITIDDSSNTYVTGYFQSQITFTKPSGNITLTSNGSYDFFVSKFDCSGNVVWAVQIGGTGSEKSSTNYGGIVYNRVNNSIQICTSIGGNAIAYSTNGSSLTLTASGSTRDAVIGSYSLNGNILWMNRYGSTGDDRAESICVDPFGNIFAKGEFEGTVSFGTSSLTSTGGQDLYLLKLTASGAEIWVRKEGGTGNEVTNNKVSSDSRGNFYSCGSTDAGLTIASTTISHTGAWGGYFVKYDSSGTVKWVVKTNNSGTSEGRGVVVDSFYDVYLVSNFTGSVTFLDKSNTGITYASTSGASDIAIFKVDSNGNFKWGKRTNGAGNEVALHIAIDTKSNIYINGYFDNGFGIGSFSQSSNGATDAFILMLDSAGNQKATKLFGGTSNDQNYFVHVDPLGVLYACGLFSNTVSFGGNTLTAAGQGDAYFAKSRIDSSYTFLPNDTILCNTSSLSVSSLLIATSYLWSNADTTKTTTAYTTGWYRLRLLHNCDSLIDSIYINFIVLIPRAGTDVAICLNDSVQLNASGGTTYSWSPTAGLSNPNIANPFAKPTVTTNYIVTVNNSICTGKDTVKVTVYALPTIATNSDTTFCQGTSKILTATGTSNKYYWSTGDTTASILVTPSVTTTYWVRGQIDTVPCFKYDSITITVLPLPVITVNNDTAFCQGNSKTLRANGTANRYLWSTGDTTQTITVTPLVTTTYWVRGQTGNTPCFSADTITITVLPLPTIFTNNDTTFCLGNSKVLTTTGTANHFLWSTGDTTASITVIPVVTTKYWVRGKKDTIPCYTFDTITITVLPLPTIFTNNDTTFCQGVSKTLTATGSANRYYWSTGDTTKSITVTPSVTTTYWVRGQRDTIPCYWYDSVTITILALPFLNPNNDTSFCLGNSKTLTANGTATQYLWSTGDTTKSITVTPLVTTTYWIRGQTAGIACYSYDSIKITVLPLPTVFTNSDTTFCQGNSRILTATGLSNRYLWSTGDTTKTILVTPNSTTSYWVRGQMGTIPCFAFDTVVITVLPTPVITIHNDTTFCKGNSKVLTTSGTATNYLWSNGDINSSITVTPLVTTSYWVRGQIGTTPCYTFDTVTITVLPLPTISTNKDTTFCQGLTKILNTSGTANRFLWSTGDTTATIAVSPSVTTTYIVRGQVGTIPCYAFDTVVLTIIPLPFVDLGSDQILCHGEVFKLTAPIGLPRLWSTGDTTLSINVNIKTDTINFIPQKYWVRVLGTGPCYGSDTILLYSLPKLRISSTSGKNTVCFGSSISLQTNDYPSWVKIKWSTGELTNPIVVSPTKDTTIYVTYENKECNFTDSIKIKVLPKPVVVVSPDDTICPGTIVISARGAKTYLWSNGSTDSNNVVSPKKTTIYWVVGSDGNCLSDTQKITITILSKATALFTANPTQGEIPLTVQFTNLSTNALRYLWKFGDGDTSSQFSPSHIYTVKGLYNPILIAYDSNGCNDTFFAVQLIIETKFVYVIGNVFTPNADGVNDVFEVYNLGVESMEGKIYNRWGELIYDWQMPNGKWWDGTNKGHAMPAGIYYYVIHVLDEKNVTHVLEGPITLIR